MTSKLPRPWDCTKYPSRESLFRGFHQLAMARPLEVAYRIMTYDPSQHEARYGTTGCNNGLTYPRGLDPPRKARLVREVSRLASNVRSGLHSPCEATLPADSPSCLRFRDRCPSPAQSSPPIGWRSASSAPPTLRTLRCRHRVPRRRKICVASSPICFVQTILGCNRILTILMPTIVRDVVGRGGSAAPGYRACPRRLQQRWGPRR